MTAIGDFERKSAKPGVRLVRREDPVTGEYLYDAKPLEDSRDESADTPICSCTNPMYEHVSSCPVHGPAVLEVWSRRELAERRLTAERDEARESARLWQVKAEHFEDAARTWENACHATDVERDREMQRADAAEKERDAALRALKVDNLTGLAESYGVAIDERDRAIKERDEARADLRKVVTYIAGSDGDADEAIEVAKRLFNDEINHEALIKLHVAREMRLAALMEAACRRVERGHDEVCGYVPGDERYPCECGHDALAKAMSR